MAREKASRKIVELTKDKVLEQMLAEERVDSDEFDTSLLYRMFRYLLPRKGLTGLAVLLATCEALVMTIPAYLIGLAIDRVGDSAHRASFVTQTLDHATAHLQPLVASLVDSQKHGIVLIFGVFVAAAWASKWLIGVATSYLVQVVGQGVVHQLRVEVYSHIGDMEMSYFHTNPVGRLVNRTTFDTQSISELFSDAVAQGARDLLFILVLFVVMLGLDWVLTTVLLLSLPLLSVAALHYRKRARPGLRLTSALLSRMNSWLSENISGMRENHLFQKQTQRKSEFKSLTQAHQISVIKVIQAWAIVRPSMNFITALATACIVLVGFWRVDQGLTTLGVMLTFIQYTNQVWRPVRNLAEKFNLIQSSLTSAERVMAILDTPSKMFDSPSVNPGLRVLDGQVHFEDVRFAYPNAANVEVLHGLSFDLPPGRKLALVGDTGAGKSTITHLLSRFYDPTAGRICIDGTNVRDYPLRALRAGIAIVPQDVVIFSGTIRDNIALGAQVSDAHLHACLEAVCADALVTSLEGGLDHVLEEGGRTLSSGERQLLSFARALVADPPILVLDEATANVDTRTEQIIQRAIDRLLADRSSIVVAHRLSTILDADEILVLKDGSVCERGTHLELVALGGEYARLYRLHKSSNAAA
ncbi:MAG: hypothetical protein AUK47_11040 [Deltaproteobacteria bacterium CG2_30_63_29]|nr:MAG: hypothetical protein AUK47_11040 [Deltaproteobacteria bacterium CG2_30_63_29]